MASRRGAIGIEVRLALTPIDPPTPTDPNTRSFLTTTNRQKAEPERSLHG